ncbi:hypothetical protein OFS07_00550 [Brachyspira hyodysenteriae]|nr:hypothetical protein [Brachyspira hyodysenteriae]MDA0062924.1 hypothetical protein [Brachyspira hyodysenteriae]MDA0063661.1 hypothetical protein [Brachyspira hyodysenteriae]MDA0064778.1 hypothetical protein [Brachyspira hyodysenteriae]MDA0072726.1 hypothetical protein [Brachyspira hyodysenteriae]
MKFKLILIASNISKNTKRYIKIDKPYNTIENDVNNIEIWVIEWADLIKDNRDRLTYMSKEIKVKDNYILDNIEKEFPYINFDNIKLNIKPKNKINILFIVAIT